MSRQALDTLYVRAFTEKPGHKPIGARPQRKRLNTASGRVLVFDCETTIDPTQRLRFGWLQQWDGETFLGDFFDRIAGRGDMDLVTGARS